MPSQLVITIDRSVVEPIAWAFCCWLVFDLIVRCVALWMKITVERKSELEELEEVEQGCVSSGALTINETRRIRQYFKEKHSV